MLIVAGLLGSVAVLVYDRSQVIIWDGAFKAEVYLKSRDPFPIKKVAYDFSSSWESMEEIINNDANWDFPDWRNRIAKDLIDQHFTAQIQCGGRVSRLRITLNSYGQPKYLLLRVDLEGNRIILAIAEIPPRRSGDPCEIVVDLDAWPIRQILLPVGASALKHSYPSKRSEESTS